MNAESDLWMRYAAENLRVAQLCLENALYNPSIQNAQQSVEKALKALSLHKGLTFKKTHSIDGLRKELLRAGVDCGLADEECDLLDSVYLPSKYPLGQALPDFVPDEAIAKQCVCIAERVLDLASRHILPG